MKARLLVICAMGLASIRIARAQTLTTLFSNGDPGNRIDIVILAEGYQATEEDKFNSDVGLYITSVSDSEIFDDYKSYFNLRSLFVASVDSGASHDEVSPPVIKDTAFGAYYGCDGIARLICIDYGKVTAVLDSALPANERDYVFVLVNDPTYGGSGGSLTVSYTGTYTTEAVLHEFGHTHGLLVDEYTDNPPPCVLVEPNAANATTYTQLDEIKWNSWIAPSTPIPTTTTEPALPGLYEGADYCASGMYRPTYNSRMRSLGHPYEQVNDEQMVLRLYNLVSPIDSASPQESSVSVQAGSQATFSVTPLQPVNHSLSASWYLDGALVASATSFILEAGTLTPGSHSLDAIVTDRTSWIRHDPSNLASETRTWTVQVLGTAGISPTSLTFGSQAVGTASASQPVTLSNSAATALTITSIATSGDFSQINTCGSSIGAGANCTISVTFNPTAAGTRTGTLSISDNAPGSPQTVALSGTGEDFSFGTPSGAPTSATVTRGQAANYTLSVGGQGGMSESVTFTCRGAPSEANCTVSPNPAMVGNSATTVTVTVTTTAPTMGLPRSRPLPPVVPFSPSPLRLWMPALILAALAWGITRRQRPHLPRWGSTMITVALGSMLTWALAGCGGGSGGGGSTHDPGTPTGTYTLTITGTAGSGSSTLSHSVTLTLTVTG